MAISTRTSITENWSNWEIFKKKKEKGEDGTSIKVVGTYNNSGCELSINNNTKEVSGIIESHIKFANSSHTFSYAGGSDFYIVFPSGSNTSFKTTAGAITYTCHNFITLRPHTGGGTVIGYMNTESSYFRTITTATSGISFSVAMKYVRLT